MPQTLCPVVQLEPDVIFIAEQPFCTSAGVTAGIDLCLSLVEADCGAAIALAVAREWFFHAPTAYPTPPHIALIMEVCDKTWHFPQ